MNLSYIISTKDDGTCPFSRKEIAEFLHEHLDQYGDTKSAILKCIGYAYGDNPGQDGFILIAHNEDEILGVVIINQTNMSEYIPENILVYIAVHEKARGQGVGKELMKRTIEALSLIHI